MTPSVNADALALLSQKSPAGIVTTPTSLSNLVLEARASALLPHNPHQLSVTTISSIRPQLNITVPTLLPVPNPQKVQQFPSALASAPRNPARNATRPNVPTTRSRYMNRNQWKAIDFEGRVHQRAFEWDNRQIADSLTTVVQLRLDPPRFSFPINVSLKDEASDLQTTSSISSPQVSSSALSTRALSRTFVQPPQLDKILSIYPELP
ncbi:hypothetical protein BDP27DRAFT_1413144 [Rhodocollybia butyracea]|uniref:Uncharacterized protein n=1 Tax=Rhodocollybia butyracea TaxID=206335 RepID=A0A9P5Q4F4_9AGAR|nr:hypothetical protein BDP27DRAFT_1413144 [Rhodocollybia butyracea]